MKQFVFVVVVATRKSCWKRVPVCDLSLLLWYLWQFFKGGKLFKCRNYLREETVWVNTVCISEGWTFSLSPCTTCLILALHACIVQAQPHCRAPSLQWPTSKSGDLWLHWSMSMNVVQNFMLSSSASLHTTSQWCLDVDERKKMCMCFDDTSTFSELENKQKMKCFNKCLSRTPRPEEAGFEAEKI